MKFFSKFDFNPDVAQLIYALFVIVLVPSILTINTIYILRSIQRDMDFELNNKALLVASLIGLHLADKFLDTVKFKNTLNKIVEDLPEIKAIEVFKLDNNSHDAFTSTSPFTKKVTDPVLNQLAWGTNQAYSKQIYAIIDFTSKERLWLVASPLHDSSNKKIGVLNVYLSADAIDTITNRTIRDSFFVLVITMLVVILLLLNHFRFFEASLLLKNLKDIDKLKDDFISVASHELRTPLTTIKNFTYLLLKDQTINNSPKLKEDISGIAVSAERLNTLVRDVLDVSRIEQNRIVLNMTANDVREIILSVVHELLPQANAKGLKLAYEAENKPLMLYCDKDKMQQIFINLVGNAIKYTPTGEVKVYHEVKDKNVRIFVKDTGVGISQEDMPKLFGKFSRIYHEKTKSETGTGLGLWITKQLIEKMNGKIYVESIENQGTQFIVVFPLLIQTAAHQ